MFVKLIETNESKKISTEDFWNSNSKQLPHLSKIALILLNIPSSSAYIERHFSLSGAICSQRRGNMSADLIITRSMLKANIKLINTLNQV